VIVGVKVAVAVEAAGAEGLFFEGQPDNPTAITNTRDKPNQ